MGLSLHWESDTLKRCAVRSPLLDWFLHSTSFVWVAVKELSLNHHIMGIQWIMGLLDTNFKKVP